MPDGTVFRRLFPALAILLLGACTSSQESGLAGELLFQGRPLAGAQVEVYLKGEKDRSTLPFTVSVTDADGRYRAVLPAGRYFLIGKKREDGEGGHTRMLMAECPANPLEVTAGMKTVPAFSLREMGRDGELVAEPGTGVAGRLTAGGQPVAQAYVYIYTEEASGLMGPSFGEAVQTAADGSFRIDLPAGRYFLAARKRSDGSRMGEPSPGDLNGAFPGNPLSVVRGKVLELPDFELKTVDGAEQAARLSQGKFAKTETALRGRIVDQDRRPVRGVYVFGYLDSRMVGKPSYISAPTGEDGAFLLYLGDGGTCYIGARSTFGGPMEPGEWVGTYEGRPDHGAVIKRGEAISLGEIVVREVW